MRATINIKLTCDCEILDEVFVCRGLLVCRKSKGGVFSV